MATKDDPEDWIVEALTEYGSEGTVVQVCRCIWEAHEPEPRRSGDLFFTWPYDIR